MPPLTEALDARPLAPIAPDPEPVPGPVRQRGPARKGPASMPLGAGEKRAKGRPPAADRVAPVARRGGEYVIRASELVDGRWRPLPDRPTGCFDASSAHEALVRYRAEKAGLVKPAPRRDVLIGDIIRHAPTTKLMNRLTKTRLSAFFGGMRLCDYSRAASYAYLDDRLDDVCLRKAKGAEAYGPPSLTTVSLELSALSWAVNRHCDAVGMNPKPIVYVTPRDAGRTRWLKVAEVERLLGAAAGQVWDAAAGGWSMLPDGRVFVQDAATVARLRPMLRLIPFAVWTVSRARTMLGTTWSRRPSNAQIDNQSKLYKRLGSEELETSKGKPTTPLPMGFAAMTQGWQTEDAALGFDFVIHDDNGARLDDTDYWRLVDEVRIAAGLGPEVTLHVIRHSGAVWMREAGMTPAQVAAAMGILVTTLEAHYDHYAPEFSRPAALALATCRF